jgi:hypothetical protein
MLDSKKQTPVELHFVPTTRDMKDAFSAKRNNSKLSFFNWLTFQKMNYPGNFFADEIAVLLGNDEKMRLSNDRHDILCFLHENNISQNLMQAFGTIFDEYYARKRYSTHEFAN